MADGGDLSVAIVANLARFEKSLASIEATAKRRLAALEKGPGNVKIQLDTKSAEESAKAMAAEMDRLRAKYDPLFAASRRYEAQLEELNRAHKVGAINARQHEAALDRLNREFAGAAPEMQRVAGASRNMTGQIQNTAFQVQDFAVQVAGGTSASKALAQQLPQLLGGLGMWGAVAGAAVAIGVPLATMLFRNAEEAKGLDEQLEQLEASTAAMTSAAEAAGVPIDELRVKYGDLADEVQRASGAMLGITAAVARRDAFSTARSLGANLGEGLPSLNAFIGPDGQVMKGYEAARAKLIEQAVDALGKKFGMARGEALAFIDAMQDFGRVDDINVLAEQSTDLLTILQAAGAETSAQKDAVLAAATQVESVRSAATAQVQQQAAAEGQLGAAMSETQKIMDRYKGTTRELRELTDERATVEQALAQAQKEGNAQLIKDLSEVLVKLDAQIAKVKELAAESDISFGRMIKGARGFVGALGRGIVDAVERGDEAAASSGILALIRRRESGNDYNATLDHGRWTGGPRDLVNMTLNEVRELQRQMLSDPENRRLYGNGRGSSALGAYQIVGTTLDGLIRNLGLTGDELFSREMQDRMAMELLRQRRGQGLPGLRNEWEGLRHVPDDVLMGAMGQQSIPLVDPAVQAAADKAQSERQRQLEAETRERERQIALIEQYSESLSRDLVTEQERARLEKERTDAIAAINASDMGETDKAAAIAAVNAEMQKQLTIMALMEEANRRGVDLNAQMVNSTMTYAQAIEALGEAKKQQVITDQQVQASAAKAAEAQQFWNDQQRALKDGLIDAIIAGESFADVLANVAQALAKAALQAALFGEGPLASGGGGLWGAILGSFGGGVRGNDVLSQALRGAMSFDGGGFTGIGVRSGGLDGKGGFPAILHPNETVVDHTRGQRVGANVTYSPSLNIAGDASERTVALIEGALERERAAFFSRWTRAQREYSTRIA